MVTDESIEHWKQTARHDPEWIEEWFPEYYVSMPPHRDTLTPVYYKVVSPNGPVFWRREGDTTGRSTTFYDLLQESKNGFGINRVDEEHTPWG